MQQDVQGCCQLVVVDLCLQLIRHGTTGYFGLLTFFRRSKGLADTFDYDHQVFLFPVQHHLLMLWFLNSFHIACLTILSDHLLTHLVHPVLLLCLTTQGLSVHALLLSLQEPATPPPSCSSYNQHIEQYHPAGTPEGRANGDFHRALLFSKGTIVIQHAYMQCITACTQRVIGDIGIQLRGLHPVLVKAFQHIDETLTVIDISGIAGQLNGKLVIVAERNLPADIQSLVQDDTTVKFPAYRYVRIKNLQTAEDGAFLALRV